MGEGMTYASGMPLSGRQVQDRKRPRGPEVTIAEHVLVADTEKTIGSV